MRVDGASGSRMGGGVMTESRVGEEPKAATKALGRGVCMYDIMVLLGVIDCSMVAWFCFWCDSPDTSDPYLTRHALAAL